MSELEAFQSSEIIFEGEVPKEYLEVYIMNQRREISKSKAAEKLKSEKILTKLAEGDSEANHKLGGKKRGREIKEEETKNCDFPAFTKDSLGRYKISFPFKNPFKIYNEKDNIKKPIIIKNKPITLIQNNSLQSSSISATSPSKAVKISTERFGLPSQKKKLKKLTNIKELNLPLKAICAICMENIVHLANPNKCEHDFCRNCLIRWSKECSNKCPLCKTEFSKIYVYENNVRKEIEVHKKNFPFYYFEEEEEVCCKCESVENPEDMIQCEKCHMKFIHYYCASFNKIPKEKIFCKNCIARKKEEKKRTRTIGRFYTKS